MQLVRQAAASNSVDYELVHLRGSSDRPTMMPNRNHRLGMDLIRIKLAVGPSCYWLTYEIPAKEAVTADGALR